MSTFLLHIGMPRIFLLERRSNLSGVTLVNVAHSTKPMFYFPGKFSKNGSGLTGINAEVIAALQQRLQFQLVHLTPRDGYFAYRDPGGNWHGIIRDLIDGVADMSLASLTATLERSEERRQRTFILMAH